MKFFSRIKNIFFKRKMKLLMPGPDVDKTAQIALKERNPDKIIEILNNSSYILTSEEISTLISRLPIKRRVEGMKIAKNYLMPYDLFELINNKLDNLSKVEAISEFQDNIDLYEIYEIFNNMAPDRRVAALEKCIDRFDPASLGELIETYIPISERGDMLYKYDSLIDSFSKAAIIMKMIPDESIDALKKYCGEINSSNICYIISSLPSTHVAGALRVSYNQLNSNQIRNIIMYNVPEKQRVDLLEICSDKLDISARTDIIRYGIPEKEIENAVTALADYLDKEHVSGIVEDLKLSAKFLKVLNEKFGLSKEDIS
ncbi:MAG: hypothetical protein IKG42_01135 [Clostridia bacterium]|nr:hypothetical protein [Clostridia bacterium]